MSDPHADGAATRLAESDVDEALAEPARVRWYRGRVVRVVSWTATAGVVLYSVVRLLGLEAGWFLVTTIAFTPYFALAALAGAGLQATFRHWRAAAVTAAIALALIGAVAPRALPSEQPVADGAELRVMSVNLYVGEANLQYIVDLVEEYEPDLLSVQEITPSAYDELATLGLEERLPHVIAETGWAAEGTAIYSRHPLEPLAEAEPGGIFHQPAAEVTLPDSTTFNFMAVHTAAPYQPARIPLWERDFEELPRAEAEVPWVLAGDFNATLDHHVMRELIESGYADAADATGTGLDGTWRPVRGYVRGLLRPPPVTLDHVLVDERVTVLELEVLERDGSDHAPVVATIRFP